MRRTARNGAWPWRPGRDWPVLSVGFGVHKKVTFPASWSANGATRDGIDGVDHIFFSAVGKKDAFASVASPGGLVVRAAACTL